HDAFAWRPDQYGDASGRRARDEARAGVSRARRRSRARHRPAWRVAPESGPGVVTRHVLTLDLRDDPAAIAAYREHHRRVWPEVVESLRRAGVHRMEIHMLGRRLVMILELNDGLDFRGVFAKHLASNPRVQEWAQLMRS